MNCDTLFLADIPEKLINITTSITKNITITQNPRIYLRLGLYSTTNAESQVIKLIITVYKLFEEIKQKSFMIKAMAS
jgi:hypothetical protein